MTRQGGGIKAGLGAALTEIDSAVAAAISGYSPPARLLEGAGSDPESLEFARFCVAMSRPTTRKGAVGDAWPIYLFAVWTKGEAGYLSNSVLTPRNVDRWVAEGTAGKTGGWRHRARAVLRRAGRAINPAAWPPDVKIRSLATAAAYSPDEEAALLLAPGLPGRQNAAAQMATAGLTLGGGLRGMEAALVRPADLVEWKGGRLAVRVPGPRSRLVPVRDVCTGLLRRASALVAADQPFIATAGNNAIYTTASRVRVEGLGQLSLSRARSTWLTAHLRAGTPLPALRAIAGPLSANTLDNLIEAAAMAVDPDEAVEQAMGA